jgi:serine/threonine protein kinase
MQSMQDDGASRSGTLTNTVDDPLAQAGTSIAHRPEASSDELVTGSRIDRYIVLECLGRGGMGIVYSAYDPRLDRKIALKVLHDADVGDRRHKRLVREAQALAQLAHPNVIVVFDVGSFGDRLFLTMEFVVGQTLRAWLQSLRPWRDVRRVFVEAGRGLAAAHAAHVIHRDFKPENVLVGADGRARVADFGLARPVTGAAEDEATGHGAATTVTASGAVVGTPAYMSPEQKAGQPIDARSDQYSFCVTLFEALHGRRPDEDARPDSGEVRIPSHVRRVLDRGLRAACGERYPDMTALLADLTRDPRVTRVRAGAVGVVALAALAVVAELRGQNPPDLKCRNATSKLAGVWDEASKRAGRTAFDATHKRFAAASWAYVERTLDRGGAAWAAQWTEACEATHVRGEQSEDLLDLRMDCLAARRQDLKAFIDKLSRTDAQLVQRAPRAVQEVIDFDQCREVEALRQRVRPPRDPVARVRTQAVRTVLAEAEALRHAGKYTQAAAHARTALTEARALHYPPIEADAQLALALAQEQANDYPASAAGLVEAVTLAELGRDDHARAVGMIALARVLVRLARYDEAEGYTRLAEATLARAGGGDDLRAALLSARIQLLKQRGQLREALALSQQLVALRERDAEAHPDLLANALISLGDSYRLEGKRDESIAVTTRAVGLLERTLGGDHPFTAQAINNLGAAYAENYQHAEALPYLQRALAIREAALGPVHRSIAESSENVGMVLANLGELDRALPFVERAVALKESLPGPVPVDVAASVWSLAKVQLQRGDAAAARSAASRALAIYEDKQGADHVNVAYTTQLLAEAELALGHAAVALPLAERAVSIFERHPELRLQLAEARFTLARALVAVRRDPVRARQLAGAARDVFASEGEPLRKDLREADTWLRDHGGVTR